ncbi:hypothetical protein MASR2M66_27130 [Chloroflexota bacterium]
MNQHFIYAIQKLKTTDNSIADLQAQACKIADATEAKRLLDKLKLHIEICLEVRSKEELPFCHLLTAYCYFFSKNFKDAEKHSVMAIDNFRVCGMSWNEAIAHWFLGLIYRSKSRGYLYLSELKKTLEIMTPIIAEYRIQGNYAAAISSEEIINILQEQRVLAEKMETGTLHTPPEKKEGKSVVTNKGYLVLPWLPKYDSVRAGPNGIVWTRPPTKSGTVVQIVEIDNIPHQLYPIGSSSLTKDNQITLINSLSYGWTKVSGQSMNASTPISIEDGDYVLFSMQYDIEKNAIVIASRQLTNEDYAYMVKKYIAKDRVLISETSDNSEDYLPMRMDEGYQILGTVIAIAKSTDRPTPPEA